MIAMDTATTAPATLDLGVAGMTCASCVSRVERALKKVPGVSDAVVNLATESPASPSAPRQAERRSAAVRNAGYEPRAVEERAPKTSPPGPASRRWRSACCCRCRWCCPWSASFVGQHWMLPAWLQFLLATPVQFVLGARFYKAGWHALKAGTGNMDLLVAIGTTAGWGLSMWMAGARQQPPVFRGFGGGGRWCCWASGWRRGQAADHRGHPPAGLAAGDRARSCARRRGRPAPGRGDGGRPAGGAPGRTRRPTARWSRATPTSTNPC